MVEKVDVSLIICDGEPFFETFPRGPYITDEQFAAICKIIDRWTRLRLVKARELVSMEREYDFSYLDTK